MPILGVVRIFVFLISLGLFAGVAAGQTTRPADAESSVPAGWEREVSSLAAAAASRDAQTLQSLAGPDCQIRQFNADHDQDISDFVDFATSNTVLGNHAYVFPSPAIAADISYDVNSSPVIGQFVKKALGFDDKHGQTIVMQWLTVSLNAQDGALVGVVVMWDGRPDIDDEHRPVFILMKGKKTDEGFALSQIVYGDPLGNN